MDVRVRCAAVLLRNRVKMSRLAKRGQINFVLSLPSRINREQIAVASYIYQKVFEKCRGALRHASNKNVTAQLLRRDFPCKVRQLGPLAGSREGIRQVHVRTSDRIYRYGFAATQQTRLAQLVLEENDTEVLKDAREFT